MKTKMKTMTVCLLAIALTSFSLDLQQITNAPDKGIPEEVIKSAKCIAVIPHEIKLGFVVGARIGKGVATCRTPNGWSAPAFFTITGGSYGAQVGIEGVDNVLMIMNQRGMDRQELGMSLIDTAEMYADGETEKLVGEAIHGHRDDVFLVSKVLPQNSSKAGTIAACERSLRRLRTASIDLYLLHWRGSIPLQDTLEGFDTLLQVGKIRYWGVSNFDVDDMEELVGLPGGGDVATDQVLYNLTRRGIEYDLIPWCREHKLPIMAYSPVEQGRLFENQEVKRIAGRHHVKPAQVALAWVLRQEGMIAIPRAGIPEHVRQDRAALDLRLTDEDLEALSRAFPPPAGKQPLEML